jgi:hypothetical protein
MNDQPERSDHPDAVVRAILTAYVWSQLAPVAAARGASEAELAVQVKWAVEEVLGGYWRWN